MPDYIVQEGDCVSMIAQQLGLTSEIIWNHPKNSELKKKRKDRNVLWPGDVLFLPEPTIKQVEKPTDQRHRFVRKGVPSKLRLRLVENGKALRNEPYTLDIDGTVVNGHSDGDGWIEQTIPPDARQGALKLKDGQESYPLRLGHLDPIDTVTGIKARLKSLGYYAGPADDARDAGLADAIRAFQHAQRLTETGEMNEATEASLKSAYGS
jgi:N-acetylmuramoyl-L-alanine amidase